MIFATYAVRYTEGVLPWNGGEILEVEFEVAGQSRHRQAIALFDERFPDAILVSARCVHGGVIQKRGGAG